MLDQYRCDILCDSSVETSSPLIDTQIRRSIFVAAGEPAENDLIHGDRNALFATVASRLEAFLVLRTPVLGSDKLSEYHRSRPETGATLHKQ